LPGASGAQGGELTDKSVDCVAPVAAAAVGVAQQLPGHVLEADSLPVRGGATYLAVSEFNKSPKRLASMADPSISILMPIHNEEAWLRKRIHSILEQDYGDYELVIGDNESDDATAEIVKEFAAIDGRVKYIRHENNIGANANFRCLLDLARGDYVVFAGGHDMWSTNYIRLLKERLDSNSKVYISFGSGVRIDFDDNPIQKKRGIYCTEGVGSPLRRFNVYMWADQNPIYGMMRRLYAQKTWPDEKYVAGGQLFLQRMAILGQFSYVSDAIFYRRENREQESRKQRLRRYKTSLFKNEIGIRKSFWLTALAIVHAAGTYPLSGRRLRRVRLRFQLLVSSLTVFIRFWPNLWFRS